MPTYCYRTSDGVAIERRFPVGEAPEEIRVITGQGCAHGGIADRDRQAEVAGMHVSVIGSENRTRQTRDVWPMEPCIASGVHADQSQELRDHLRVNGCPTEVTKDGDPIYTSASHRKRALKCRGMHDKNSFN